MIDYSKIFKNSIDFLVKYAKDYHLQSYILGISGGIDSTVTAAVASLACKELNIPLIGRSLPTKTNKSREVYAANLVGKAFCTDFKEVDLETSFTSIFADIVINEKRVPSLQKGNIKARLRMIYLYNLASINKGCVLDTDNKTEHSLGFWTLNGDVGDINCGLIHLWKTEVYKLADYIIEYYEARDKQDECTAIRTSYSLIPTDGNGVSSSDCEQFGLESYTQVDDVLQTMIENSSFDEYTRLIENYGKEGVDKVLELSKRTAFKRRTLPVCPYKEPFFLVN